MASLLKYIGLANVAFFGTVTAFLANFSQNIDLKEHTISYLASDKKIGKLFNLSLFVFAIVQVVFSIIVSQKIGHGRGSTEIVLFVIGGIFLCLASIFTTNKRPLLHTVSAGACVFFVSLGVILLSMQLLATNKIIGIVALGATMLIPISYLLRNKLTGAYWEFVLFSGVFIWNIVLTVPLFL
jgi:hypothetical membrane protein